MTTAQSCMSKCEVIFVQIKKKLRQHGTGFRTLDHRVIISLILSLFLTLWFRQYTEKQKETLANNKAKDKQK